MAGRLNEEQAGVNTSILDVSLSLRCEFLSQIRGVLILDIFDDGIPAAVIVDQIAVARGVDNVESETNAVLLNDVGYGLDFGRGADGLVGLQSTLGVNEVRGEDCVDQSRLAQSSLA